MTRPPARRCPVCRGLYDTPGPAGCVCGQALAPFPAADLTAEEWAALRHLCAVRSDGICEIRSEACLGQTPGKGRNPGRITDGRWSLHHRQPRGAGGTSRANAHSLAVLLLVCGDGTRGCHGWAEHHRAAARARGLLVPQGGDPATTALVLPGGQRVYLDPVSPLYLPPPPGEPPWEIDTP